MSNRKYLAIYDFRILPISLGDILQWLALKKLEITLAGFDVADIILVYPKNFRGNLINEIKYIGYWDSHFREMVKVFESTDFIEKIIITDSVNDVDLTHYLNRTKLLDENKELVKNIKCFQPGVWSYIRSHQSFDPFNSYHRQTGGRVTVGSKQEIIEETSVILDKLGLVATKLLVCQPRFRMIDKGLPFSDPYRDSIYIAWANFFQKVDAKCILIGRSDSIPSSFQNFKNVHIAREIGLDIQHELALLRSCKFFLGASSGFAIAAHFSDVRHKIFGVMKAGYENYGVSINSEKLLFANPFQNITKNEINFKDLSNIDFSANNIQNKEISNRENNLFYLMCFDFIKIKNQIKIDDLISNYSRFHQFNVSKLFIFLYVYTYLPIRIFCLNVINYKNVLRKQLYFGTLGYFIMSKLRKIIVNSITRL